MSKIKPTKVMVLDALQTHKTVQKAATALGIKYPEMQKYMRQYGIVANHNAKEKENDFKTVIQFGYYYKVDIGVMQVSSYLCETKEQCLKDAIDFYRKNKNNSMNPRFRILERTMYSEDRQVDVVDFELEEKIKEIKVKEMKPVDTGHNDDENAFRVSVNRWYKRLFKKGE